jgi:chromate transporter
VGALAFGGGQAALPLVERLTVAETGWLTPGEFATGIGLAYITPGPVLILAAYVGYRVAAVPAAVAATLAVFAVPVVLAAAAAHTVRRLSASARFRAFGRTAGAAAIGLLGVTLVALSRPLVQVNPALLVLASAVALAARRGVSPFLLLALSAIVGAVGAIV